MALTDRMHLFVYEYLKDLNASAAARRAGYTGDWVNCQGYKLMKREDVQQAIVVAFADRAKKVNLDADELLRHLHGVATADVNEIIEHRRTCCRHCYGVEFKYQRTVREMQADERAFKRAQLDLVEEFDTQGGNGFNAAREPNAECLECSGEGVGNVFIKDTRLLSPAARALYAGAKQTRDGVEVKLHGKDKAVELLMRHMGLLNDKLDLTVKGDLAERLIRGRKRAGN